MVRKTDGQKNITIIIIKGADVLDHYNIDLLLKRRGKKSEKNTKKKKEKKRSKYVVLDFSADLVHAQKKEMKVTNVTVKSAIFSFFFIFSPWFSFSVSPFVSSSSSLNGFVVEKLVSSIQRKVSEYISTNEMGFFCNNSNTHTHTPTRRKGRRINLPTFFESLKCSLLLPTSLVPTYLITYLPKYLPIHPFFCFCFCFCFFFLGQLTTTTIPKKRGLEKKEFIKKKLSVRGNF